MQQGVVPLLVRQRNPHVPLTELQSRQFIAPGSKPRIHLWHTKADPQARISSYPIFETGFEWNR
jgi:hypothetical protein